MVTAIIDARVIAPSSLPPSPPLGFPQADGLHPPSRGLRALAIGDRQRYRLRTARKAFPLSSSLLPFFFLSSRVYVPNPSLTSLPTWWISRFPGSLIFMRARIIAPGNCVLISNYALLSRIARIAAASSTSRSGIKRAIGGEGGGGRGEIKEAPIIRARTYNSMCAWLARLIRDSASRAHLLFLPLPLPSFSGLPGRKESSRLGTKGISRQFAGLFRVIVTPRTMVRL